MLKSKKIKLEHSCVTAKLSYDGYYYVVTVGGVEYKRTPVQRYAVQCFNAI